MDDLSVVRLNGDGVMGLRTGTTQVTLRAVVRGGPGFAGAEGSLTLRVRVQP